MLSHDEDRQLRAIEQWFEESDPVFTRMLRNAEPPKPTHQRLAARIAVDVTGGVLFTIGALTATAGLLVIGLLAITIGACLHVAARG
ncbi:MAG: DUF3040 domain-containing protein [Actinophytocola sp.]|uniref:DUF3040 domain-containing protein n=1 Tax=Actinophytocola sp. TaxID=1872138 RepID=UPI00132CA924|nr:DUF3040 domain-containing protein [Actinophytocola sp.]MPZ85802.1 DUF3040 domain-containing protein [Actinophytocola sp.]